MPVGQIVGVDEAAAVVGFAVGAFEEQGGEVFARVRFAGVNVIQLTVPNVR